MLIAVIVGPCLAISPVGPAGVGRDPVFERLKPRGKWLACERAGLTSRQDGCQFARSLSTSPLNFRMARASAFLSCSNRVVGAGMDTA